MHGKEIYKILNKESWLYWRERGTWWSIGEVPQQAVSKLADVIILLGRPFWVDRWVSCSRASAMTPVQPSYYYVILIVCRLVSFKHAHCGKQQLLTVLAWVNKDYHHHYHHPLVKNCDWITCYLSADTSFEETKTIHNRLSSHCETWLYLRHKDVMRDRFTLTTLHDRYKTWSMLPG